MDRTERELNRNAFYRAVSLVQQFVGAFECGYLPRRSLVRSLPKLADRADHLALDGLLFDVGRRLDRRGELSRLASRDGLVSAVEALARRRLRERGLQIDTHEVVGDSRLRDIAADRGCTAETLRRHITDRTGVAPREWRQRARVVRGIELIRAGWKIEAVARECGYRSERAFYAVFRKLTGITPGAVRRHSDAKAGELSEQLIPKVTGERR